jgi:hypothetical protein
MSGSQGGGTEGAAVVLDDGGAVVLVVVVDVELGTLDAGVGRVVAPDSVDPSLQAPSTKEMATTTPSRAPARRRPFFMVPGPYRRFLARTRAPRPTR